ncbi:uncharacterized protein LOC143557895 [Bidens hawaiensis]|uniref:uncharacterized protein LOC143557895 n=1 Tax=Bidens hawaiensis TaxID=980011 RepID=UPI00404B36CF
MVISWILNTLTRVISDSCAKTAQILWNELNTRYGQSNDAKFYQLQKNLCQITQGSSDIAIYFTKMKSNWDELNDINTIPSYTCRATQLFARIEEDQRPIQFLVGFNPSYDTFRSSILMMQPLPSINHAYCILIQDEKQKEIHTTTDFIATSASMNASSEGPTSRGIGDNRRTLVCTH